MGNDSSDFYYSDEEISKLIERYRSTIAGDEVYFFEPEELEAIIDAFLKEDDLSNSCEAIDYGLKMYPGNEGLQILNIHYHILDNKIDSAERMANQFIEQYPENVEAYIVLASVYSERDKHDDAVELLEKAREMDPDSEQLVTALSMEYQMLGLNKKAIGLYLSMLERDSEDEFALNELVFVYELTGAIEEAIVFLLKFTDEHPFNQHGWFQLANVYNLNNQPDKAVDAYEFALAADASFLPALFGKGHSLLFLGDIHRAIDCFREVAEHDGLKSESYFSLGEAFSQLNNYGSAADNYMKCLNENSFNNEARIGLANSLYMLGLDNEAIEQTDKVILNDSERTDVYQLKGTILMNTDRYSEAIAEFRNAIRCDKDNLLAWLDLSEAHHFLTGTEEALAILEEAQKAQEDESALIYYRKAAILFETGENQQAVSELMNGLTARFELYTSIFDYNKSLEENEIIIEIVSLFLNQ